MKMLKTALATTLLALAVAGPALAQSAPAPDRINVPREQWLSPAQIIDKLASEGYTVREIEADDGVYEVEATIRDGVRVEMDVHPVTGEIIMTDRDD